MLFKPCDRKVFESPYSQIPCYTIVADITDKAWAYDNVHKRNPTGMVFGGVYYPKGTLCVRRIRDRDMLGHYERWDEYPNEIKGDWEPSEMDLMSAMVEECSAVV